MYDSQTCVGASWHGKLSAKRDIHAAGVMVPTSCGVVRISPEFIKGRQVEGGAESPFHPKNRTQLSLQSLIGHSFLASKRLITYPI